MVSVFYISVSLTTILLIILSSSSLSSSFNYGFLNAAQAHSVTIPIRGTLPFGIAYNPANNNTYVANFGSSTVSVISSSTDSVIATILVGREPIWIAYAPPNNKLYVTNFGSNDVYVINGATNKVIKNIPVGNGPFAIAYSPSNNNVYVTNSGDGTVSVIDTSTDTIVGTIELLNVSFPSTLRPAALAYYSNGAMYVGGAVHNELDEIVRGHVSVINTVTNADVQDFSMPTPVHFSEASGFAYNSNNNRVYVSAWAADSVVMINPDTNSFEGTVNPDTDSFEGTAFPVGKRPFGILYNPTNNNMYVVNTRSNTVSVIGPTDSVIATIPTGLEPVGIAYNLNNLHIYVTNFDSNTVSLIHP
jgi:YVTN family beta-propeller protein